MKVFNVIEEIAEMTPENAQAQTRDEAIKNMGKWGKKLAMAALPTSLLMLAIQKKAQAGTAPSNAAIGAVLNFALTLEYLESTFYNLGLSASNGTSSTVTQTDSNGSITSTYAATPGFITSTYLPVFTQIAKHENAHVALLLTALSGLGVTAIAKPEFDFTGGNSLSHNGSLTPTPFSNFQTFLALSQAFEDTGVRAYKGQAAALQFSTVLTTALQIHSVEARHASEVRRIRGEKGWITEADTTLPAAFASIYTGGGTANLPENNVTQGGVNVYTNSSADGVTMDAATEAFDEPLDMASVVTIADNFIIH
jgi:hypothetical protein